MSGALFLGIAALMSLGVFLNGRRFSRLTEEKLLDGRTQIEMLPGMARGRTRLEQARLVGRVQMIAAPLFLLLVAALCFGLLGPVDGIETIELT